MGQPWLQAIILLCLLAGFGLGRSVFQWMEPDLFDDITDRMDAVNWENCASKSEDELYLPDDAMSQKPQFNKLLINVIYPNRSSLVHVHNMALNRAFFYSYAYQKLNESDQFEFQPGLMYYYFSAAADISANEYSINGSGIMFDNNCSYATFFKDLLFNNTLPLFGPRAWRFDDYNDPTNWLREPTNNTFNIVDYGAGPQSNYSLDSYKINQWYRKWLPDTPDDAAQDSSRKHSYDVGIKYSNETGVFEDEEFIGKTFYGPPSPGIYEDENLPVVWTQPYYDCGRANKWIVSAVAPVVDHLPRYLDWFHIRRHRFVAVSTIDVDFFSVDFNPCPLGIGNEPPNYFAGTARCKPATMCEPLYGWGFRRGGYHCVCRNGYRYPPWQEGPYLGIDIESATEDEYRTGFDCLAVEMQMIIPVIRQNDTGTPDSSPGSRRKRGTIPMKLNHGQNKDGAEPEKKKKKKKDVAFFGTRARHFGSTVNKLPMQTRILKKQQRFYEMLGLKEESKASSRMKIMPRQSPADQTDTTTRQKTKISPRYKRAESSYLKHVRQAFDFKAYERMNAIIAQKESTNKDNCHLKKREDLTLPGDVSYGGDSQFTFQARTAVRLSHFLSNFLQNIDAAEEYGNLRGDNLLNFELIFGEVLANVMGDLQMKGSGVFFDINKFIGPTGKPREFFGPYAYRFEEEDDNGNPGSDIANTNYRAVDFAGFPNHYLDKPYFKHIKERWQSNTYGLTKYTEKPMIRSDVYGTNLQEFEMYPMYYYAASEEDGWWSAPYFDCEGYVKDWLITYSIPFFGLNSVNTGLEFKGVVTVDIKLNELDMNQCPMEFYTPNAFKGTARCHYSSTYCEPLPGLAFTKGGYKCECLVGYEFPYQDNSAWYYDGQTMEAAYRRKLLGLPNSFDNLKCRIAGASRIGQSWLVLIACAIVMFMV